MNPKDFETIKKLFSEAIKNSHPQPIPIIGKPLTKLEIQMMIAKTSLAIFTQIFPPSTN